MLIRSLASVLVLGSLCAVSAVNAEDAPRPPRPEMRPGMRPGMRREGAMPGARAGMQRNNDMFIARMVAKEIKAYQESPTDENYKALEKATREAVKKFTEQRKKMLEKQLAELDKNQDKTANAFLENVKSGKFKMPPQRMRPGKRGPRPGKDVNPPAAN